MTTSSIIGTNGNDKLNSNVTQGNSDLILAYEGKDTVTATNTTGNLEVYLDDWTKNTATATPAYQTNNTDTFTATRNYLFSSASRSTIWSHFGKDIITTGDGNDTVHVEKNYAGTTVDTGKGLDLVLTGYGADNIKTGDDSDHISTQAATVSGSDVVDAGAGDDFVNVVGTVTLGEGSDTYGLGSQEDNYVDGIYASAWVGKTTYITDFKVGTDRIDTGSIYNGGAVVSAALRSSADGKYTYLDITKAAGMTTIQFDADDVPVTTTLEALYNTHQWLNIKGSFGADTINGSSNGDHLDAGGGDGNVLYGRGGDDSLIGSRTGANGGHDTIYGGDGNDLIISYTGNDIIDAGSGDDRIEGTIGGTLTLGAGKDTVTVGQIYSEGIPGTYGLGSFKGSVTYITDFKIGEDIITSSQALHGFTYAQGDKTVLELYEGNSTTNPSMKIIFDSADVPVNTPLQKLFQEGKIVIGDDQDNIIKGEHRHDILNGNGGNDTISGGAGDDQINGGDGDDKIDDNIGVNYINGGNGNDIVNAIGTVTLGAGRDTFMVGDPNSWSRYVGQKVYMLDFKIGEDRLASDMTGIDGKISTSADGKFTIIEVTHNVMPGTFYMYFDAKTVPATTPLEAFLSDGIVYHGTQGADTMIGTDRDDVLWGEGGNDTFYTKGGDDEVFGGAGRDTYMIGEADTWVKDWAGGRLYIADFKLGEDKLASDMENLDAHWRTSDDGRYSVLDVISLTLGGTTSIYFNIHDVPVGTSLDLLTGHKEGLYIEGSNNDDVIKGTVDDDKIFGNGGNDIVSGSAGDDQIHGGDGADRLRGDDGNDDIYGDNGDDSLTGGNGNDHIGGGAGNDRIYGEDGNDRIYADNGEDSVDAGKGDDVVYGSFDKDLVHGREGNDQIFGGDGDDKLYGDAGDDTLYGGLGKNLLDGGDGNDRFLDNNTNYGENNTATGPYDNIINAGAGNDWIQTYASQITFGAGKDKLIVEDWSKWDGKMTYITDMSPGDDDGIDFQLAINDFVIKTSGTSGEFTDLVIKDTVGHHEATIRFDTADVASVLHDINPNDIINS